MRRGAVCRALVLAGTMTMAGLLVAPAYELSAQQTGQAAARGAGEEQVDSTRLKIMQQLQRLDRGPVSDSVLALADSLLARGDTLAIPEELRPTGTRAADGLLGPRPPADDATTAELETFFKALPGYLVTEYDGASADFDARNRSLVLQAGEGSAEVRREGMVLTADSAIVYDEANGMLRAQGDSVVSTPPGGGDPVTSKGIVYDLNAQRGSALGAQTQYREGGNWRIYGDLPYLSQNTAYGSHARFTSCDLDEPHYHFETDELKIVGSNILVARPVRLYFDDVPVAWLPFVAQSLSQGRSSGILTPRFSVNDIARTSAGYQRRISNVGFYWAISDYMDAAVAGDWFSGNYSALTGQYRYAWREKFLEGGLNFKRYWRTEGGRELSLDTRHGWEPDERTQLRISARFMSSLDFQRENTFDPREVTGSVDSEGGINRRFDWGTVALSANRRQFLNDDRVESTLPQVTLSLQPITIFGASPNQASWYNNWTWNGSTNFSRRTIDRPALPDSALQVATGLLDQVTNQAGVTSTFNFGAVSWSQTVGFTEQTYMDSPILEEVDSIINSMERDRLALSPARAAGLLDGVQFEDLTRAQVQWNTSLGYQQRLIGTTTLTPRVSLSGSMLKDSEIDPASETFVAAPTKFTLGVGLKADVYGFWPGFTRYSAIRHKLTTSIDYDYAPSVTPSDLQREVFNARDLRGTNQLSITFNQTFEGKVQESEDSAQAAAPAAGQAAGPRRQAQSQTVNLLSIRTSAITYDFQRGDSLGSWTRGLTENLTISNSVASDFLRGLALTFEHDVFDETTSPPSGPLKFSPHLSRMNLSFSLGSRSGFFMWLSRLTGGLGDPQGELRPEDEDDELLAEEAGLRDPMSDPDPSSMIPGVGNQSFAGSSRTARQPSRSGGGVGSWNANLSYSLVRPRLGGTTGQQMIQANLRFKPTEKWDVSWQTSYDLAAGGFNDHILRFTRDLHRWEASFDFRQTATGNWSFNFEVSLLDNRDLKFDYRQQDLVDAGIR